MCFSVIHIVRPLPSTRRIWTARKGVHRRERGFRKFAIDGRATIPTILSTGPDFAVVHSPDFAAWMCDVVPQHSGIAQQGYDIAVIAPAVVLDRTAGAQDEHIAVRSGGGDSAVPTRCPWVTAKCIS